MNTPLGSPLVNHESTISDPFDQMQSLEENLKDFEGFFNRENDIPQVRCVVNNLRYILISYHKGLELLHVLTLIIETHAPSIVPKSLDTQTSLVLS